ncbi:hypothetical protein ACFQXB_08525 [Plastorhodobacter daqingensis]|uniref:Uncharacterized protein n=1 Tax=Plastorhodobacter daqingensis TaxID=1387281 RepID=A0ABW2UJR0_9RHOB
MTRLADVMPATAVAVLGIGLLGGLNLVPRAGEGQVAAVFAPWVSRQTALARVADLRVPILAVGWKGRLITVDTGSASAPRQQLRDASLFLIRPRPAGICSVNP